MSQEQKSFNPKHTVKALSTIPLTAQPTKRDGDCALHALFGEWDAKEQQFICPDAPQRREKMARAIEENKAGSRVHKLAIAGN